MATKTGTASPLASTGGVNDLTFNQLATVLNSIVQQATGQASIAPQNTGQFVSVAQTALKMGYDPLINSISQVLGRTIFSIRPYTRKFPGIQVSEQKWGYITRKLQISDADWEDDMRLPLENGKSVDQWVVKKPNVLQTNFYGVNMYAKHITLFKDQLDSAFNRPEDFARFITMVMTNSSDMIEQTHESTARSTIANFIAGKVAGDTSNVVHLVSEYNAATGSTLTPVTVMAPVNFPSFLKWATGRIKTICDLLTERTVNYHINVTNHPIARHTPYRMQKIYLSSGMENLAQTTVFADVFHDSLLRLSDHESVNFWQNIESPYEIQVQPIYLQEDGSLMQAGATTVSNLFGVIFDEEALGYTVMNRYTLATPMNASGSYSNLYFHYTERYWNDFTENGIVLLLD